MEQPSSDYDGAWKYALDQYFAPFLALFFPDAFVAIDWSEPIAFRDTELQQIAPEDQAGKQRVDKLVRVRRLDGTPAYVFIHVEVQSQHDTDFASRMFRYHARLYDRDRIPVVSLAVLGDESADWRPNTFGYKLWGCVLALRFPTVKLLDLDTAALGSTKNPFATLALLHRDAQATRGQPEERLRRRAARYRALLRQQYSAEDIRTLLRLIEHMLRLGPRFTEEAHATMQQVELEETGMDTFVTSIEEFGRLKGQRDLVVQLLNHRVGQLSLEAEARIAALSPEILLALSKDMFDFTGPHELLAWLDQHGNEQAL